jgi:hypothetical protein
MQSPREPAKKKPYRRPVITTYGTVRDLTRSTPTGRVRDGSSVSGRNRSG